MDAQLVGFREIEHTADWELEAWAPDLTTLLRQAAIGMYALAGVRLQDSPRHPYWFDMSFQDPENLVVSFLSELLYFVEQEGLAFENFRLSLEDNLLHAALDGAPIASLDKEIKAVTYHNLAIHHTAQGFRVRIVFDV